MAALQAEPPVSSKCPLDASIVALQANVPLSRINDVKVIGRKSGSSAVASAAYRSGSRLRDERLERSHDFSGKRGVVHSEVMLPEHAPQAWSERERLWNDVEAF